jgi:hypothetical protein
MSRWAKNVRSRTQRVKRGGKLLRSRRLREQTLLGLLATDLQLRRASGGVYRGSERRQRRGRRRQQCFDGGGRGGVRVQQTQCVQRLAPRLGLVRVHGRSARGWLCEV